MLAQRKCLEIQRTRAGHASGKFEVIIALNSINIQFSKNVSA